jgi:DNA-binding transcriptional LysR family regulator
MANSGPDLDVGRLLLLREVALRGTIAAAARSVGLTPSAVSQQLAALEREAGSVLLDRSPRGVALTGAGHALAARAASIVDVLAAARADLDRISGAVSGPVRVAAVASAAATLVSTCALALRKSLPGVEMSVVVAEPARALRMLLADDVDIAVVDEYDYVPLALPEYLVAHELCAEDLVVVAAPGRLSGRRNGTGAGTGTGTGTGTGAGAGVALASLAASEWVMPPVDAACGMAVRSACRAAGFEPRVRWETDDMLLLVRAVAADHGISVLPRLAVADDIADVDVRPLRRPALGRRIRAVTRSNASARPVVASVLAAMAEAAG